MPAGVGGSGAVDEVAAGREVELCVDVVLLQAGDGAAVGAGGRGGRRVAGARYVGGFGAGGVVGAEGVEEVPIISRVD